MPIHPLLLQARKSGNPVISGGSATLLWQGHQPPRLLDDLSNWETARPFERLGTSLWAAALELPLNAYFEYGFFDPSNDEPIPDPLNPQRVANGMGGWNHFFYMPKGKPTPLVVRSPGTARGVLTRHKLACGDYFEGRQRSVVLYQPAAPGPFPLLVVYDGSDYLRRAHLDSIVDNLVARGQVRPFAMACLQNGGSRRMLEYACSDITLGFLLESVLPLARTHLDLQPPTDGAYGVMGASMGGLMALYTGMRLPGIFSRVLSQSGAFRIAGFDMLTTLLAETLPRMDLRAWLDIGRFESLLDCNRSMAALLEEKGCLLELRQYSGGHNYTAWANDLPRGLQTLFKP